MRIEDFEHKRVANEWDMAWFCDGCGAMKSYKTKAWIANHNEYCYDCMQKLCNNEKLNRPKGMY